jgi:hypothetical protein
MGNLESFREKMRQKDPHFDQVEAALDQFAAGGPVTERCAANGERIVVERSDRLGKIRVRAGDMLLRTLSFEPNPDSQGPLWRSSEDLERPSDASS